MSNTNKGGPAFPVPGLQHDEGFNGMALRDYFAAKAMQASRARDSAYETWGDLATDAYEIADAMLKAREA